MDGIGVESRDEPHGVGGVEDDGLVEQDEVLVVGAATDGEVVGAVGRCVDSGHELQRLERVGLAKHHDGPLDLRAGEMVVAHGGRLELRLVGSPRLDRDLGKGIDGGTEREPHVGVGQRLTAHGVDDSAVDVSLRGSRYAEGVNKRGEK